MHSQLFAYAIQGTGCLNPVSESEGQKYLAWKAYGPPSSPQVGSGLWVLHLRRVCGCLRTEVPRMMSRGQCKEKAKGRGVPDPLDLWGFIFTGWKKKARSGTVFLRSGSGPLMGGEAGACCPCSHYTFCLLSSDCLIYKQSSSWGEKTKQPNSKPERLVGFFPIKLFKTFN